MRRWLRGLLIGVVTGACGAALAFTPVGAGLEKEVGLPWLFKARGAVRAPAEVVVVAINGVTGTALGLPKLPRDWSRTVHAQLIDRLVEHGAAVVVFDFDFSRPKPDGEDGAFARAIGDADRVVLLQRLVGRRQPVQRADGSAGGWIWVEDVLQPAEPLALAAKALGPFPLPKLGQAAFQFWTYKASAGDAPTTVANALQLYALDVHGPWLDLLRRAGAQGLDDLPARVDGIRNAADVRRLMGALRGAFLGDPELNDRIRDVIDRAASDGAPSGELRLVAALAGLYGGPGDRYLNFYGPPGTIKTIPYYMLFTDDGQKFVREMENLSDKVVFVGYSDLYDPEQPDHFYTVFTGSDGVDLSGVEIMATAFANLLTDRTLRPSGSVLAASITGAFGLVVGAGTYLLPAMGAVPLAFAVSGLYGVGAQWAFNGAALWLPLATPLLVQLPLALLLGLMGQYLLGRQRERRFSEAISYYLPENVVRDLTESGVNPDSVNKVVYGTCLATDMSGFTAISETKSPKELAEFMNAYFDALARSLKRHAVDVTEFHADTIMCAWTAPEPDIAARRKAVFAAIGALEAIEEFNQKMSVRLSPRIGLQDGHFYLGHTGGGGRMAYSILGDPANTAARLESLNKHLGTYVLAAASVVEGVEDLLVRPVGSFRFVGKTEAMPVVEVLARRTTATTDQVRLCERFRDALHLLRARRWSEATEAFEALLKDHPGDGPSTFFLNRCELHAVKGPSEGEDPTVVRMDAK